MTSNIEFWLLLGWQEVVEEGGYSGESTHGASKLVDIFYIFKLAGGTGVFYYFISFLFLRSIYLSLLRLLQQKYHKLGGLNNRYYFSLLWRLEF